MAAHRYHLQSLLYTAAADRFLAARVPGYEFERDFGGSAYVFLRGIGPDRRTGIYRDRFPLGLVRAIQEL
jgi:exodeoxyribonuclease V beta subunit